MLYMSNDRKHVFDTEQECYEYEQRVKKEKANKEQREKLQKIKRTYEELEKLVLEYGSFMVFKRKYILSLHIVL